MSMGLYGKGVHFRDSHRAEWDRLLAQHPEVLDGSSGEHMVWELADPKASGGCPTAAAADWPPGRTPSPIMYFKPSGLT
jgi:hypothetical protein